LLTEKQVLEQKSLPSPEEPQKRAAKKRDDATHLPLLSHFTCGRQLRYPVESTSGQNFGEG